MEYEDRIGVWGIKKLEERRVRGRMIQIYKEMNKLDEINLYNGPRWVDIGEKSLRLCRDNNKKGLVKEYFTATQRNNYHHFVNMREDFLPNSVVDHWNALPDHVM